LRGQKLFVRPIEPSDQSVIDEFMTQMMGAPPAAPISAGLLGKVVGELVVVLGISVLPDSVRIELLVVTAELRRKRIGGFMIDQLDAMAAGLDRLWLTAARDERSAAFLRRIGFEDQGDEMRRRVGVLQEKRR
jgi:GNAT superfamily N-acetyltransferase